MNQRVVWTVQKKTDQGVRFLGVKVDETTKHTKQIWVSDVSECLHFDTRDNAALFLSEDLRRDVTVYLCRELVEEK